MKIRKFNQDICPDCNGKGSSKVEGITGELFNQSCSSCNGTGKKEEYDKINYIEQAKEKFINEVKSVFKSFSISHGFIGLDVEYNTPGDRESGIKYMEVMANIHECQIEKEALDRIFDLGYETTLQFRKYPIGELTLRPWEMFEESKFID